MHRCCRSTCLPDSIVKSAARALDVLEYFANTRAPAGVAEIARALGYPRSSTSVLLGSLVKSGYLRQDAASRRFVPTPRVALLGAWIESDTGVQGLLEELRRRTGETVILAQQNGLDSQYIQVLESQEDLRLIMRMGTRRPLVRSVTGYALLSRLSDAEILRILQRSNAQAEPDQRVEAAELMAHVQQVREWGHAFDDSRFTPGGALIAALWPGCDGTPPMAVGVGGPSRRIAEQRERIVQALHELIQIGLTAWPPERA
jgi:DNA-binding IclR family transcriptional regulator